jgi:hypothetical protein
MLFAKRFHLLVFAATLLATLLLSSTNTDQTKAQDNTPTATATDTVSDVIALADQIANGPHTTVKSSDGRLTLLIPDGALPATVRIAAIKITAIRPNTVPVRVEGNPPTVAYRFEPDGLQFSTPAIAVLTMRPFADETLPMLFSVSGENVEPITSILYEIDPKTRQLIVTAPVAHFSDLVASKGLFGVNIRSIADHVHDSPFNAEAVVFRQEPSPIETWKLKGHWTSSDPVSPRLADNSPPTTSLSTKEFTVKQPFTCKGIDDAARINYIANIDFELNVLVKEQVKNFKLGQSLSASTYMKCIRMVQSLVVTFGNFTSTYNITASHPEVKDLTYTWSNSNPCGEFSTGSPANTANWVHPHNNQPGACPEEGTFHPGEITVVVTDTRGASETVTYKDGSAVGFCKFSPTDATVEGSCSITP